MRFDIFIISVLLASLMLIGGTMFINENVDTYNITITNEMFINITNRTNEIFDDMNTMKGDLEPEGISSDSALDNLISGAYNAVTKIWQSVDLVGDLVKVTGKALGVPPVIMDVFLIIILISILFAIIYMIFRFQPR